ncbi:Crp/Fnr family transcriptional regulator [Mucilaginibacter daejeonensis]|uniref:Crp/Fnr family transcriptional regulator n=1 Tax=Mucilaginibacter daejeonensis TaxID=398049 RepID=UPI001D1752D0|nr:Crp/Fnr family transcriptional regulator [Mucilaginibacter daejeonensis]UEG52698.1 Crp/Fnr family transcriptional regulator [Mucilaginibacter daejeonensis]
MFQPLIDHIQKIVLLSTEEQALLTQHLQHQHLGKKKYLFSEGERCNALYFVVKGCLRMYFIKDNGTEQIIQFGIDNWWISDHTSLMMQAPSQFYLQAVEDSQLIILPTSKHDELLNKLPKMEKYFRHMYQRAYAAAQNRTFYFFDMSGEEKYHNFARRFPDFVQRVPQYMLASYLGFSPEFLSRVRAKDH